MMLGFAGRSGLFPFERTAIEEVVARLGEESASLLRRQVDAVNRVQRITGGKEVNLYRMRFGKAAFDDSLRFAGVHEEALLATVHFPSPLGVKAPLKLELWLASGRLFSLVFDKPPRKFFASKDLRSVRSGIVDVRVWMDPIQSRTREWSAATVPLSGWLRDWQAKGMVSKLMKPLSKNERSNALARIDAVFPADYLEFLSQTDGAKLGECIVYGAWDIRAIVAMDANYYVIAELDSHAGIAIKDGSSDGEVYIVNYENDLPTATGQSIKAAIENLLRS